MHREQKNDNRRIQSVRKMRDFQNDIFRHGDFSSAGELRQTFPLLQHREKRNHLYSSEWPDRTRWPICQQWTSPLLFRNFLPQTVAKKSTLLKKDARNTSIRTMFRACCPWGNASRFPIKNDYCFAARMTWGALMAACTLTPSAIPASSRLSTVHTEVR